MTSKQVVEGFFSALNEGALDKAFSNVADDVRWWVPGALPFSGTKNKAGYLQIAGMIQKGFPGGLTFELHAFTVEGERVAVEAESKGDHANGKHYNNRYHFVFVVRSGQIVEVKEYMDTQHLAALIS